MTNPSRGTPSAGGGCPVDYQNGALSSWWKTSQSSSAVASNSREGKETPTLDESNKSSPPPPSPPACSSSSSEEAALYAQTPQPDQTFPLNTQRQVSSIPRGSNGDSTDNKETTTEATIPSLPHHQFATTHQQNWVYPSEQQLYNAMRRKGWSKIPEDSIPIVLQIHNIVNESTWLQVLEYHRCKERVETDDGVGEEDYTPRLVRFQGRPKDLSPKAWLLSTVLGYPKPFDRHDWYVEYYQSRKWWQKWWLSRGGGGSGGQWLQQRYVIDFYENSNSNRSDSGSTSTGTTRVDVRPALDHPRAVWLHAKRFLQLAFPGITNYYYNFRSSNTSKPSSLSTPSSSSSSSSSPPPPSYYQSPKG